MLAPQSGSLSQYPLEKRTLYCSAFIAWVLLTLINTPFGAGVTQAVLLLTACYSIFKIFQSDKNYFLGIEKPVLLLCLAAAIQLGLSL